jgi:serine/threonine protein kinase
MICPVCHNQQSAEAQRCRTCGTALSAASTQVDTLLRQPRPRPTPGHAQPALQPGDVVNGRYVIRHSIGSGAFGRVYLAEDREDPQRPMVAVKELLVQDFPSQDDRQDAIAWFKREVSALLTLDHPGIPSIHGYWSATRASGPFYLAMDYIPGKTLADLQVLVGGRFPWWHATRWSIELCAVLGYLHGQAPPYVFRDLKPANVMIHAGSGLPVLIDFGLARHLASVDGTAIGTWGYVPFEQVLGKAEPRSDQYALAAVLHEILSNRHPAAEYRQLLRQGKDVETALHELFPPLGALDVDVPPALADVVARGTAFAPEERFPDMAAMRAALEEALVGAHQTVSAPRTLQEDAVIWRALQSASDPASDAAESQRSVLSGMLKPAPPLARTPRPPIQPTSAPDSGALAPSGAQPRRPSTDQQPEGTGRHDAVLSLSEPTPAPLPLRADPILDAPVPEQPRTVDTAQASGPNAAVQTVPGAPVEGQRSPRQDRRTLWGPLRPIASAPPTPHTTVLRVDPTGTSGYRTITAALRDANPGTRIEVEPGTYRESLYLDHTVEIVALGNVADTVLEATSAACIVIRDASPTLKNLTLRCTAPADQHFYALNIAGGTPSIQNCVVTSTTFCALGVHGPTARPILHRCTVAGTGDRGLMIYSHAGGLLEDCDLNGRILAARVSGRAAPVFRNCRIHGGRHGGITFVEHGLGLLHDCTVTENGHHGLSVRTGGSPIVRRCRITGNGWCAVSVAENSSAIVEYCDLTGNGSVSWDVAETARARVHRTGNREVE